MNRYSRQVLVYGKEAQEKIEKIKVAVVGLGGTGTHILDTLVRSGFQNLLVIDRDIIEESNLQRQTLYTEKDIGKPKADTSKDKVLEINSDLNIKSIIEDINPKTIEILNDYDVIIDATDNMYTRILLNEFSKKTEKVFIYSGAIKEEGLVALFTPNGPCLRCLIPNPPTGGDTCDILGVTGPTVSIAGNLVVNELLNFLSEKFEQPRLISVSLKNMDFTVSEISKRDNCETCQGKYENLESLKEELEELCSSGFQFNPQEKINLDLVKLENKLSTHSEYKIKSVSENVLLLRYNNKDITIFKNGRMILKNFKNKNEAKILTVKLVSL